MAKPRELRRTYGFDEVAISPGALTVNPDMVDTSFKLEGVEIDIPILGSAMDAVANPSFAGAMHKQGALSVMNLEGVQTRYDEPQSVLEKIAESTKENVTSVMQEVYSAPIKEHLLAKRVKEIKSTG